MIQVPLAPFFAWCLVFLRVLFLFSFFPLWGERFVPVRIRILIAVVIAIAVAPVAPVTPAMFPLSVRGLLLVIATEALLGFGFALIGRILFAIVQFSGQIMGEQMGYGIINAIDPTESRQVSVIAEMLYLMSVLLFLAADLHHVLLATVVNSFHTLAPGGAALGAGLARFMLDLGTTLFELSLRLAMPIIVIVFAINVGLGMIARGVPQINVFMESFPLRIIAGVSVLLLMLGIMASQWEVMFSGMEGLLVRMIGLMKG